VGVGVWVGGWVWVGGCVGVYVCGCGCEHVCYGLFYFRGERLTPQMGVFFKCSQSMRDHVCYSQTWLYLVAAGQLSFIVAQMFPEYEGPRLLQPNLALNGSSRAVEFH